MENEVFDISIIKIGDSEYADLHMKQKEYYYETKGYKVKTVTLSPNITKEAFIDYLFTLVNIGHTKNIYLIPPFPTDIEEAIGELKEGGTINVTTNN